MTSPDTYEAYAVRYARHDRRSPENFIGGDPHDLLQPLDYFVWVIVGASATFVVDTGFDEAMARHRGRVLLHPVGEGLRAIGVDPDGVQDVIVTHLHYDHCGNVGLFPRARYHLQDLEMAKPMTWWPWCARCSRDASCFTMEPTNWRPASRFITSAATPGDCSACG
jgi:glyoxylase-like metal-dependent hydrolase (beta-lactamase superfamily II)